MEYALGLGPRFWEFESPVGYQIMIKEESFQRFKNEPLTKIRVWGFFEAELDIENYEDHRNYIKKLQEIEGVKILSVSTEV